MTLLTAHKILIAGAVGMFTLYAGWELYDYSSGDSRGLLHGLMAASAAVGFALYLRWVWMHRGRSRQ
jgi:hypothetical protein